ncbi:hypothetical protein EV216_104115 [Rhodovulum steppense]|uniref:Uncharacterized protein n=1 Tax=Rhodovulum steppense TaxID=540251 RepID=A0A4R1Z0A2_9RHOB|nr:hypothetical protein [Rhodovulum steppense]TCM86563.1 hypothetical protein EV216_104115 [Rhodovulum steppense]
MLGARKAVQQGFITLEMSLRGLLRNFGLKVGSISRGRFEPRIRELTAGNPMLETATEPMLRARQSLRQELAGLERRVRQLAQEDPACRRMMSTRKARRENWLCLPVKRQDRRSVAYHVSALPSRAFDALISRILDLPALDAGSFAIADLPKPQGGRGAGPRQYRALVGAAPDAHPAQRGPWRSQPRMARAARSPGARNRLA